jgi:hypothetical protein
VKTVAKTFNYLLSKHRLVLVVLPVVALLLGRAGIPPLGFSDGLD